MGNQKKILIADDDTSLLDMMTMMLEMDGYQVRGVSDGASLLPIHGDLPDLLLLDIWMSGSDGRDICRQLKSDALTRHLPIVLVSASRNIQQSAREAGADGFIAKPFEMTDFLATVKSLLSR